MTGEPLDLEVHDPEEWEGKSVDVGGASYTIGPRIGAGSSKIVHRLFNDRSGLSELALKVWLDTSSGGPEGAQGLRRLRGLTGIAASVPSEATFWAHGGCLQLQAYFGDVNVDLEASELLDRAQDLLLAAHAVESHGSGELKLTGARAPLRGERIGTFSLIDEQFGDPAGYRIDEYRAVNLESGGRPLRSLGQRLRQRLGGSSVAEQAMACYQAVLEKNPEHTEALHNAAGVYAITGDIDEAASVEMQVVLIEPNYLPYLQACTYYNLAAGLPRRALFAFEQAHEKFPYAHDQDGLACTAYLACGEPERAAELLDSPEADETLRSAVADAVRGHETARALLGEASRGLTEGDSDAMRRAVREATRVAPSDLRVRASAALLTRAGGDPAAALDELVQVHDLARPRGPGMHCLSTAAACALELGDLDRAADLLDRAWSVMRLAHGDGSAIDPDWIPGIAVLFVPDGTFERPMSAMADLLETTIRGREGEPAAGLLAAYAAKYREAAALTE